MIPRVVVVEEEVIVVILGRLTYGTVVFCSYCGSMCIVMCIGMCVCIY